MKSFLHDKNIAVRNGEDFHLKDFDPDYKDDMSKESGKEIFEKIREKLPRLQEMMYAQNKHSLLLVFQAIDAAGKDGTIRAVMSGINPQGCHVVSFKQPSAMELEHDFLWRCYRELPEHGHIGIFNRSYYEEVLVTRVHPEYILAQNLQGIDTIKNIGSEFWKNRFESIRHFEKHLTDNGTIILKFFLNLSKEEQKKRFLERIDDPEKNWKFSYGDLAERKLWNEYQHAYQEAIANTATEYAPWFVIPADSNWMRNMLVCSILHDTLEGLNLSLPKLDAETKAQLKKGREDLLRE